ncbi:MAG: hypothetical protein ACFFCD_06075 [Promethearchaeota archaeon]
MQGYVLPSNPSDIVELSGELFLFAVGVIIIIILLPIWKRYFVLNRKGKSIIFGFIALTLHFFFDMLDTIAASSQKYYETQGRLDVAASFVTLHATFDILDSLLGAIGLFLIVFGTLKVLPRKLWDE